MKTASKILLTALISILFTSCGSGQFVKYKKRVNYNLMRCQQLCSSGNVTQIAELDCACNFQRRNPSNLSSNSSANGNVSNIYINGLESNSGRYRTPANNQPDYGAAGRALMNLGNQWQSSAPKDIPGGSTPIIQYGN